MKLQRSCNRVNIGRILIGLETVAEIKKCGQFLPIRSQLVMEIQFVSCKNKSKNHLKSGDFALMLPRLSRRTGFADLKKSGEENRQKKRKAKRKSTNSHKEREKIVSK